MTTKAPIRLEADASQTLPPIRGGTFAALSVAHYPPLLAVGFLWNLTRWMSIFLCSYLVTHLTHSPFLVQAVGTAFFAPMFLAGAVGGVVSDRLDRLRTMTGSLLVLIPTALIMAVLNLTGVVQAWMVYPFMLIVGLGMVVEMTTRRAFVYDLVGPRFVANALALEALAMTSGTLLGSMSAGTVISLLGIGQAFLLVALFYTLSLVILRGVPRLAAKPRDPTAQRPDVLRDIRSAFAYLRRSPTLISILGVTVIMNTFYFSFVPMVPVFADKLGVNAFWAGVLASGTAIGSTAGSYLIARGLPIGRGRIYAGGTMVAMGFLGLFAISGSYPMALVALIFAGFGLSGFSTMQSVLVMTTANDAMRGRAMGLLSMAIGALPFAMLILGGVAQAIGPSAGVAASAVVGVAVTVAFCWRRPEAIRTS